MQSMNVKFTLNNFEYFLLTIQPKTEIPNIISKLNNFMQLNHKNNTIAIELGGAFEYENLNLILENIKKFCIKNKIKIYGIAKNQYIECDNILDIEVINLPSNHNSITSHKLIYNQSLLINEPVRSGIKIENDGDIILTSFVSDNAEIIASGNIHVYSEARGRLIAGNNGNKKSRIFVMKFNPVLISIAGIYRTLDSKLPDNIHNKSVQVFLGEKERLNIVPL